MELLTYGFLDIADNGMSYLSSKSRGQQMKIRKLMDEVQYMHFQVVQQDLATKENRSQVTNEPLAPPKKKKEREYK